MFLNLVINEYVNIHRLNYQQIQTEIGERITKAMNIIEIEKNLIKKGVP